MHSSFKDILWDEDVDTDCLRGETESSKEYGGRDQKQPVLKNE